MIALETQCLLFIHNEKNFINFLKTDSNFIAI